MDRKIAFFKKLEDSGIDLNSEQREAVSHVRGPLVVFAGPGSGKTTVLTCRAAYLLQVENVHPQELLIVTFTKAAAEEMKNRLALLPDIGWLKAKSCEIGTFHSVFLKILLRAYGKVPRLLGETEQRNMIREILRTDGADGDDEEINELLGKIGLCKNNLIRPEQIKAQKPENQRFKRLFTLYESMKSQQDRWDYDDILLKCHELLVSRPDVRTLYSQKYRFTLVDEFQDTNRVQFEILKMLTGSGNLCIVGDDDQSIYRFRGSRVEFLLSFEQEFKDAKKIILATNYRSTDAIIQASSAVIARNKKRQFKELKGTGKAGKLPTLVEVEDELTEARKIVQYIKDYQGKQKDLEDIAILYRSHAQAQIVIEELVKHSVSFSVSDMEGEFYQQWQVRDILAYFQLALNPDDLDSLLQIINRPKRYLYNDTWVSAMVTLSKKKGFSLLHALQRLPGLETWQRNKLEQFVWDLKKLSVLSPSEALRFILQQIGYENYLEDYAKQTQKRLEELREPLEILRQSMTSHNTIKEFLAHVSNVRDAVRKARSSTSGVKLMTLHRAKGLEFQVVFLIGLIDGILPHKKSLMDKQRADALEEERRLFYVGMTRAKNKLFFSVPKKYNGSKVEPSPFVKDIL